MHQHLHIHLNLNLHTNSHLHLHMQPLTILGELATCHTSLVSAYGSLNCSYLEVVPGLWREEEVEVVGREKCGGVGTGKARRECSGGGLVHLKYREARLQETVQWRLQVGRWPGGAMA